MHIICHCEYKYTCTYHTKPNTNSVGVNVRYCTLVFLFYTTYTSNPLQKVSALITPQHVEHHLYIPIFNSKYKQIHDDALF